MTNQTVPLQVDWQSWQLVACTTEFYQPEDAHENWSILRLLPLIIGYIVQESKPGWHLLMDLEDIVELVVSPFQTDDTIRYLDTKISEHRHKEWWTISSDLKTLDIIVFVSFF